ncbi:MAG: rod shape-determining protein MreC [Candidatus Jacksonbacteria bacterium]
MYYLHLLTPVEKILALFFHPVQTEIVQQGANINKYLKTTPVSKNELIKQVAALQSEINDLNIQLLKLQNAFQENQELKNLLNFKNNNNYQLLTGEIVYKNNSELEKSIMINLGSKDGIRKNDAVTIGPGMLIGKVIKTSPYQSLARLTIDNKSSILAALENAPYTISGVVQGLQGTNLSFNYIPKNIAIIPKQKIITNGLQENLPSNLFLGQITQLQENENNIFNSALVETPYNIEDLKIVGIIINHLPANN